MTKNTDPWPSIGNLAAYVADPFRRKERDLGLPEGAFQAYEKMDGTNVGMRAFGPSAGQLLGRHQAIDAGARKYQGVDLVAAGLRDAATLGAAQALVNALLVEAGMEPGQETSAVVYGELIVGSPHGYGKRAPPSTVAKGDWFVFGVVFGGTHAGPALRDALRDAGFAARFAADADGRHSMAVFLNARFARLVGDVGTPPLRTPPAISPPSSYASLPELVLALEPLMTGVAAGMLEGVVVTDAASGFVAKWKVGRVDESIGKERLEAMADGDAPPLSPRTAALVAALERVAGHDRAAPAAARNGEKQTRKPDDGGGDRDFTLAFDSAASKIDSLSAFRARGCLKEAVEFLTCEIAEDYATAGRRTDTIEVAVKREVGRRLKWV